MIPLPTARRRTWMQLMSLAVLCSLVVGVGIRALPLLAQTGPATGVVNTEDSRLNLRSAPEAGAAIVAKLDPQTPVTILATSDDGEWLQVEVNGIGTGWVAREFITTDTDAAVTSPAIDATPATDSTAAATEAAPRVGILGLISPAATSEMTATLTATPEPPTLITGTIPLTETAVVTVTAPVIAAAATITATAAVTATLTATPESAQVPTTTVPLTETAVVTVTAPVATAAATVTATAPAMSAVAAGGTLTSTLVVTPTTDVEPELVLLPTPTPSPVTATPTAAATTPASAPTPRPEGTQPTPDVPTAVTQPARMNVRGGPSTDFPVVGSVDAGTALAITGASPAGDWYRVTLEGVDEAWVYASLVAVVGPVGDIVPVPEDELPVEPTPAPQAVTSAVSPPVVAAPPTGGGSFGYGVQAHMLAGEAGNAINAVGNMGFNWVKQQVQWKLFQPSPGPIGFGDLSGIVNEAGNRGINVLFSVVNAPDWAREPGFDAGVGGPPADPATYAAFVGAMAGEFCGTSLKAIEVWNEQNLHYEWGNRTLDPAEYMNLLRPAYAAIKSACPQMLVISGAPTPAGSNPPFAVDDFAYLEGMYQNGLKDYADGIGAHPSGYNVPADVRWEDACAAIQVSGNTFNGACDTPHHSWSFRSTLEGYRNIMVVYGDADKRVWPTEFGWAAGGAFDPRYAYANDNSFDEQAAWTVEAYTLMRNWGWVGPAFLWNLNFRVVADGTEKAQWGIVRNDYGPLPVYDALKGMAK